MAIPLSDLEINISEHCHPSCRTCVRDCLLLQQLGINGGGLVEWKLAGGDLGISYSCTSCELCTVICNRHLSAGDVLKTWRQSLSNDPESSIVRRSLRQTDLPENLYNFYDNNFATEENSPKPAPGRISFFPGCAMSTYTPELAHAAYGLLCSKLPEIGWLEGCCYDPLEKLGLVSRYEIASQRLCDDITDQGVQEIITVCPTCTYRLQALLPDIQVISIYEWMVSEQFPTYHSDQKLAIHDACPDRFTNRIGKAVRKLLGVNNPLMKHEERRSLCCGAGADVPTFNPDLAQAMAERRLAEAEAGNAQVLVTYCTNCAVQLANYSKSIPVIHALDLLLGKENDYQMIALKINQIREHNDKRTA